MIVYYLLLYCCYYKTQSNLQYIGTHKSILLGSLTVSKLLAILTAILTGKNLSSHRVTLAGFFVLFFKPEEIKTHFWPHKA